MTSGLGAIATVFACFVFLVTKPDCGSVFFTMKISLTAGFVFCSLAACAGFNLDFSTFSFS